MSKKILNSIFFLFFLSSSLMASPETIKLKLPKMMCKACSRKISLAFKDFAGLIKLETEPKNKLAIFNFENTKTDVKKIRFKLKQAGYESNIIE